MMKKNAFTLIELSIVLVIIGLVAGGVLVGKELYRGAEFRAQASQFQQFSTASNTFRLKYNCLAGDCINATSFGLTGCLGDQTKGVSYNGNGNRKLAGIDLGTPDGAPTFTDQTKENYNFWYQLNQAGLISEAVTPCGGSGNSGPVYRAMNPQAKMGNAEARIIAGYVGGYQGGEFINFGNVMVWTLYTDAAGYSAMLTPLEARAFDSKIDDGKPQSGKLRVVGLSKPHANFKISFTGENTDNAWCTFGATNDYTPASAGGLSTTKNCSLGFQFMR